MGRPKRSDNRIKFTTTIEKSLLEDIKIKAIKEYKNVNDLFEQFIIEYLK